MRERVLIIAEAGVNHNGDVSMAERMVDAAAAAGADFVKFQTFKAERLLRVDAQKAEYQKRGGDAGESQYAMIRRLELDEPAHRRLLARCRERGIGFLSTPFDADSARMLAEMGVEYMKVPSGEAVNLPLLRAIAALGRPVILSTGMCDLAEVRQALDALVAAGAPPESVTVLHCNTEYPTPFEDVNLRAMQAMAEALGVAVGYSDHTPGIEIPVAAVALGATVVEKHFTLDRSLPGPDHAASLEPGELAAMVRAIRNVERALGDGVKRASPSELKNRSVARRSIVAARDIRAGEVLAPEMLAAKRPGDGVSPMRWDEVVGSTAVRDFARDEPIELAGGKA